MRPCLSNSVAMACDKRIAAESTTPANEECKSVLAVVTAKSKVTMPLLPPKISSTPSSFLPPDSQITKSAVKPCVCLSRYSLELRESVFSYPSTIPTMLTGNVSCSSIYSATAAIRAVRLPLSSSTPRPNNLSSCDVNDHGSVCHNASGSAGCTS